MADGDENMEGRKSALRRPTASEALRSSPVLAPPHKKDPLSSPPSGAGIPPLPGATPFGGASSPEVALGTPLGGLGASSAVAAVAVVESSPRGVSPAAAAEAVVRDGFSATGPGRVGFWSPPRGFRLRGVPRLEVKRFQFSLIVVRTSLQLDLYVIWLLPHSLSENLAVMQEQVQD